ncbi:hypothetical protein E2542_SST11781 [Spatholobus suberectus]|nr:hypothetical protein E2542_SST11781 [Spatholobus suberectus]
MDDGGGVPFSVVYFDGHTEATVCEVTVDPSFNFNKFLSFLSQKIGISPHKFSVYLATLGTNRRIPITGKVNFAAIARDNAASSFFLVERSKRPRSRRNKSRNKGSATNGSGAPPQNVVLLRRNDGVTGHVLGRAEYDKWVRDLQMERERYLMSMGMGPGGGVLCEECLTGSDGGFHWCVYDAVTVGFRSPAGPVARPVKGSGCKVDLLSFLRCDTSLHNVSPWTITFSLSLLFIHCCIHDLCIRILRIFKIRDVGSIGVYD